MSRHLSQTVSFYLPSLSTGGGTRRRSGLLKALVYDSIKHSVAKASLYGHERSKELVILGMSNLVLAVNLITSHHGEFSEPCIRGLLSELPFSDCTDNIQEETSLTVLDNNSEEHH